jgi:protein-disulfide isomerase
MLKGKWILASLICLGLLGCDNDGTERYRIPVTSAPARWGDAAKVTIVEYSDYQCPFCARVEETLARIEKDYGGAVRLVWKDNPLPFHTNATPAAEAARAAGAQGRFWPMHDLLMANQKALSRADLESYAAELKLDVAAFKAALDDHRYARDIAGDVTEAKNFGALGTPTFFINGRVLRGAQPYEQFKQLIDEEIMRADLLASKGVRPSALYDEITRRGLAKAAPPKPMPAGVKPMPKPTTVAQVDVGKAPVRGSGTHTVVVFSDYQCPFCQRLETSLAQVSDAKIVWKNFPLPMHDNARLAAEAALAAGDQGKFWEMHDLMFQNQDKLSRADLEGYAQKLNLDLAAFRTALDTHKFKQSIDDDIAVGQKAGVQGTPTMVVDGKVLHGALPLDTIKAVLAGQDPPPPPSMVGDCKGDCDK